MKVRDEAKKADPSHFTPDPRNDGSDQRPCDIVGGIIAFEQGTLSDDGVRELFQCLVSTGLAWTLPGSYGRTAKALIEAGEISA